MNTNLKLKTSTANSRWKILRNYVLDTHSNEIKVPTMDVYELFTLNERIWSHPKFDTGESEMVNIRCWDLNLSSGGPVLLALAAPYSSQGDRLDDAEDNNTLKKRLSRLIGFDSTGLVHLWPSELLLAHFFFTASPNSFVPDTSSLALQDLLGSTGRFHRACELAAGSTGAAGLALATAVGLSKLSNTEWLHSINYIAITDGNQECLQGIRQGLKLQQDIWNRKFQPFGPVPTVEVKRLRWPVSGDDGLDKYLPEDWCHSFDLVFAADCFFNVGSHQGLLQTVDRLLSPGPGSLFLAVAPRRGGTLAHFVNLVSIKKELGLKIVQLSPSEAFPALTDCIFDRLQNDADRMVPYCICLQRM